MQRTKYDIWVGLFVMLGIVSIVFLALKVGNLINLSFDKTYTIHAQFSNVGSVASGAPVKSAGVVVGRVHNVVLDNQTHQAIVAIEMQSKYTFSKDSSLNIMTSGLLGEEYIAITPGIDDVTLEQAGANSNLLLTRTQPSVAIGEILSEIMPGSDGNKPLVGGTYTVHAQFSNIGAVKVGSAVKSSGVVVGRVREVLFDSQTYQAQVVLELLSQYPFPSDSSLRIMSSGIIGGQFIEISPGFEEEFLEEAAKQALLENAKEPLMINNTQSAIVLEDLIGQVLYSMGSSKEAEAK